MTKEEERLEETRRRIGHWNRWGPFLSDRQWGTVREDYSRNGDAWEYFPHTQAASRVYRWGEDGIGGFCDRHQLICFAIAFWNGRDPILKERFFGVTGNQGNHGEDVKEYYFYLDSTPTHSYMKFLYKYPHGEYPYSLLLNESSRRGKGDPELELLDSGIFQENRYFDVFVEYAKADAEDILIRITTFNRGPEKADLHLLPTIWFRNTWSWDFDSTKPSLQKTDANSIELRHPYYNVRRLYAEGTPELLFTENETNTQKLFGVPSETPHVKDAFHRYLINGEQGAINQEANGTKAAILYRLSIPAGEYVTIRLRFSEPQSGERFGPLFETTFEERKREADEYFRSVIPHSLNPDAKNVLRQAIGGLLWSKQFYQYDLRRWLEGDPTQPPPPPERRQGRNHEWKHLYNSDVISMPDKWEYPWYAAWDLAFHCVVLALVDPTFAKQQLILLLREWYMHPNGQLPAYEWAFGDVNPPVHAWAAFRVYKIEKKRRGQGDFAFLERVFHKLLLNFTWWVNRKDAEGNNVFEGGFLGLDNIGIFDRSKPLPTGGSLEQSDGTSWMAMFTLNLLAIAMELAKHDHAYEDVASKFWEHFIYIAHAMSSMGEDNVEMWNEEDGFFYDVLHLPDGNHFPLKIRSMVGLIPLFAVETLEEDLLNQLPGFKGRLQWFIENRPDLTQNIACPQTMGHKERRLLSIVNHARLRRVLRFMLDENEFLSPYGIRALSRYHKDNPYRLHLNGAEYSVAYEPGESQSGLFGGNSNWRGPLWFPANFLIIESLQKFHHYFGPAFRVEFPTGSGKLCSLWEIATELSRRLIRLFLKDANGKRPMYGNNEVFQNDPNWKDLILFYEYFHGDSGEGLGASHQTGWTALIAKLLQQSG